MKKGKEICKQLKQIRLEIARTYGIKYSPRECHHEGDCAGTCPACDSELRYLEQEISRKSPSMRKVAVVGISMGLASLSLTSCIGPQIQGYLEVENEDSTCVIEANETDSIYIGGFNDSVPDAINDSQDAEDNSTMSNS